MQTRDKQKTISQSDWYHERAAECNRMALARATRLHAPVISRTVIAGGRLPPSLMRQWKL